MPTKLLLLAALTASLSGCLFGPRQLGEIDSHPNVLLTRSPQKIALELAPSVPEKMQVPGDPSFIGLDVDRWHESLSRGFHNGIAMFFGNDAPAYRLVILRADPQLVSDGPSAGYSYGARSATALIRYQAELLDAQGKTIVTFAGTAVSPQHVTDFDGTPYAMTHAIDEMYERIADKIPANLTATAPQPMTASTTIAP